MKPLDSSNYVKSNIKRVLPILIATILSVFLIYTVGLILFSTIKTVDKSSTNIFKDATGIFSNNIEKPIERDLLEELKSNDNIERIIPCRQSDNSFMLTMIMGNFSTIMFDVYSEDLDYILERLNVKLIEGQLPKNNYSEVLIPKEIANQESLKVGDIINKDTSKNIKVSKDYKVVGIVEGNIIAPIVCDIARLSREEAVKYGFVYFFEENLNSQDKELYIKDKNNYIVMEYSEMKEDIEQLYNSIYFMFFCISTLIVSVVVMSLSNLNYIIFLNRKPEFALYRTLGFSKGKVQLKLLKENTIVSFIGYIMGLVLAIITTILLNIIIFEPKGQYMIMFNNMSLIVTTIVPIVVTIFSSLSSLREIKRIDYNNLNI